ncbi:MAG: FAD-dependent oxidoreductase, partial [Candidatus Neomarinimicrobiota bacterium]
MNTARNFDVIVIGGGIGGWATALRAVQNGMQTLLFTGSKLSRKRSRSQWVANIDNMIGFHQGVIKDQAIATLRKGGHEAAADLLAETHYHINNRAIIANTLSRLREDYSQLITILDEDCRSVERRADGTFAATGTDETFTSPAVVLATGIMDEQPQIPTTGRSGEVSISPRPIYPY